MNKYNFMFLNKESINISQNDIDNEEKEEVVILTLNDLNTYYETKSKEKYFIKEDETQQKDESQDSKRNELLDKYSDLKSKDIIADEKDDLLTESIDIVKDNDNSENLSPDENLSEQEQHDLEKDFSNIDENKLMNNEFSKLDMSNQDDVREIFNYLDDLLGNLPEDKIKIFAKSKYFKLYKKLLKELGVN